MLFLLCFVYFRASASCTHVSALLQALVGMTLVAFQVAHHLFRLKKPYLLPPLLVSGSHRERESKATSPYQKRESSVASSERERAICVAISVSMASSERERAICMSSSVCELSVSSSV